MKQCKFHDFPWDVKLGSLHYCEICKRQFVLYRVAKGGLIQGWQALPQSTEPRYPSPTS